MASDVFNSNINYLRITRHYFKTHATSEVSAAHRCNKAAGKHCAAESPLSSWRHQAPSYGPAATGWSHRLHCSFLTPSQSLHSSLTLCLYCSVPALCPPPFTLHPPSSPLSPSACCRMDGCRGTEGGDGRGSEVRWGKRGSKWDPNEMPRCVSTEAWGSRRGGGVRKEGVWWEGECRD